MSQYSTYEQLIAQKLQELTLPDRADAIWRVVERQLDIEMPINGKSPSSGTGGLTNINKWLLGGLMVLFMAVFIHVFSAKQKSDRPERLQIQSIPIQKRYLPIKHKEKKDNLNLTMPSKKERKQSVILPVKHQAETIAVMQPAQKDTITSPQIETEQVDPVVMPPSIDTIEIKKKTKGVRGISDKDYRLVPDTKNHN